MYIIYVKNYKKRLCLFLLVLALWIVLFFLSGFILENSLLFNVTINDCLEFSYPVAFDVNNIYVNDKLPLDTVQTSSSFKKALRENFSSYKNLNGRFSFSYPSAFVLNQENFSGGEILYHIDFHDKTAIHRGFVQVWDLPYPLEEFLENSKSASLQTFKYFSSKKITVNGLEGYFWDYSSSGGNGKYYKSSEVFLKKGQRMYRISYFVPEDLWNDEQEKIFWHMVSSFKAY